MTVLIVGASVAGVRTAQALRLGGSAEHITLVDAEAHTPYDKPPLSKGMVLHDGKPDPVPLLAADELDRLGLDLRLGVAADSLDAEGRLVTLADRTRLGFDRLVIATGVRARTLPGAADLRGVHTVRSYEDAIAVREALSLRPRVVVIGAGFIGAELASAAVGHGAHVTIIETQHVPLSHLLGGQVGAGLARLHHLNGVMVETGVQFEGFVGGDQVTGVRLADGRTLPAELVVIGIGATPNTEWLASAGLPIEDGVSCRENLEVVGWPGIYAAGDVARWHHPFYDAPMRIEHWTNANEHAALVAADILGGPGPRLQVPYVWSDQYGHRIQIVGRPTLGDVTAVLGVVGEGPFVAIYGDAAGVAVGAVVVDDPRALMKCRRAVTQRSTVTEVEALLSPVP